jgi:GNAT superfamily N-acetyltransferase
MEAAIRDARPSDAAQLALVHVRSWQEAYRGLVPQAYLDGLDPVQRRPGWERTLDRTDPARGGVLVAEDDARLVGFASYGPSRDDDAGPGPTGEVFAIYLLPEAWGHGTGRQLMDAAVAGLTAAGYERAALWVLDGNARARRFYQAAGWTADGAVKQDDRWGFPLTETRYRRSLR